MNESPLSILIVTSDMPSHPYAATKLAKILAKAEHKVTLAAPGGPAMDRVLSETLGTSNVTCVQAGTASTEKHVSEREVVDPLSWKTLWNNLRHPYATSVVINELMDSQEGMFQPICDLVSKEYYDLVIPIHSIANTVCDAVEAAVGNSISVMIFSSLPYDPAIFLGERKAWNMPRSLTIFPHVAAYSSKPPRNPFCYLVQLFWKILDSWLSARMWAHCGIANNQRRAKRGLGPIADGWRGYVQQYPVLTFGGTPPFLDNDIPVASNVLAVGALHVSTLEIRGDLKTWLEGAKNGIVYVGFGTGVTLSSEEASNITGDLLYNLCLEPDGPHVLWALRTSERKRLRPVIDTIMCSEPSLASNGHLEYLGGRLRIQGDVPQSALLSSGQRL